MTVITQTSTHADLQPFQTARKMAAPARNMSAGYTQDGQSGLRLMRPLLGWGGTGGALWAARGPVTTARSMCPACHFGRIEALKPPEPRWWRLTETEKTLARAN